MKHLKNILKKHFAFIFPILPVVLLAIFIYSCGTGTTEESSSEIVEEAAGVIAAPCELIDAATAHDYFTRYMATKPDSIVTKGIVLNNSNVRGIQYLNSWIIPSPVGYRAYYGIDEAGKKVSMLVGTTSTNTDIVEFDSKPAICVCSAERFGTCPMYCDVSSPIPVLSVDDSTTVSDTLP